MYDVRSILEFEFTWVYMRTNYILYNLLYRYLWQMCKMLRKISPIVERLVPLTEKANIYLINIGPLLI